MSLAPDEAPELQYLGLYVATARREQGLSQLELANRCRLAQAQISYFESGRRRPTLDQLLRIARALDVSIQRLIGGSDRPGEELRDIAVELRHLGIADLWVAGAVIPGAFRRSEEVIAQAISAPDPDPRIIEAIPTVLAWSEIDPVLLRAYGLTSGIRTVRRMAWLADVALAIDRQGGFPGGCDSAPLDRFTRIVRPPAPEPPRWDSLGHPMSSVPKLPLWKRWKINYDANLAQFEARAEHLNQLRAKGRTDAKTEQTGDSKVMREGHKKKITYPPIKRDKSGEGSDHAK
jgi:transcriptional regulator with XRE-family HTH domain